MTRITENIIEGFAIKLLEHLGYAYIYLISIAFTALRGTLQLESESKNLKT